MMMFHTAVFTTALMITSNVAANDDSKCFCPVGTTGGKCRNSNGSSKKYRSLSTHPYFAERGATGGIARCKASCAEDPDRCKGYAWRADIEFDPSLAQDASVQGKNCHLYDYVPDSAATQSDDGTKDFTDYSCFGMSGTTSGTYTEFPKGRNDGGKCSAPVYSGSTRCETPSSPSQFCAQRISVPGVGSVDDCIDWCDSRGNLCEGFDYGPVYGNFKCWERRYKPTGAGAPSSRKDYSDWRCHAKDCNCD